MADYTAARLNAEEAACVKRLAELFTIGQIKNGKAWQEIPAYHLGVPPNEWDAVLFTMEKMLVIESVEHAADERFGSFMISANVVHVARQLREKENQKPEDIVERIQNTARQNPLVAWLIIGFFVLTAAATLINQTIQILQNLGWIAKP